MASNIDTAELNKLGLPPNRANIMVVSPISTSQHVGQKLMALNLTAGQLPKEWDWRKKMAEQGLSLEKVQNQANCGNCWAMSSTACLTDRFRIIKNRDDFALNPLSITACNIGTSQGCGGGFPADAGHYYQNPGASQVSNACMGWETFCTDGNNCGVSHSGNPHLPDCKSLDKPNCGFEFKVKSGENNVRSLIVPGKPEETVVNMKAEIMANGPVVTAFFVPKDFMFGTSMKDGKYKWNATNGIFINGAYQDDLTKLRGPDKYEEIIVEGGNKAAHAVETVGWGYGNAGEKYGNVYYWIIKNSWGPDWNEDGYFRFAMYPLNDKLGMDVGITMDDGYLFGGATTFEPDETTGPPKKPGGDIRRDSNGTSSGHKNLLWLWILLGVVGGLLVLYLGWKMLYGKHGKRKHKRR